MTEVLRRVLARELAPLRSVRGGLPEGIYQVCDRALADEVGERYPHADALREAWAEAWAKGPPELRNATVPRFRPPAKAGRSHASAPASTVQAVATPERRPATGRTPQQAADDALAPTVDPITGDPGRVVRPPPRSTRGTRRAIGLALGGAAVAGAAAVVVLAGGRGRARAIAIDAGVVVDAGPPPVAIDAGAPPGMVRLAGGNFTMGSELADSADALPPTPTEVAPFLLDRVEVTALMLRAALQQPPRATDLPDLPAQGVTWPEADAACRALGKRLPTEAEWEYAARRGAMEPAGALLKGPGVNGPAAVGTHPGDCTADGVCDLLGNLMEWTADGDARSRVARGASYRVAAHAGWYASIHARARITTPERPDPEIGFRCAADAR
jgi:formylglycine-generating enzyme required for sulfatase activity